jgi:hypothetical protein
MGFRRNAPENRRGLVGKMNVKALVYKHHRLIIAAISIGLALCWAPIDRSVFYA